VFDKVINNVNQEIIDLWKEYAKMTDVDINTLLSPLISIYEYPFLGKEELFFESLILLITLFKGSWIEMESQLGFLILPERIIGPFETCSLQETITKITAIVKIIFFIGSKFYSGRDKYSIFANGPAV